MNMKELRKDLGMLFGWPPYDGPENICRADGYFANSLEKKYGKPIEELETILERCQGL